MGSTSQLMKWIAPSPKHDIEATRMCAAHHVGIGAVRIWIVGTRRRSGRTHDVPIVGISPAAVVPVIA